MTISASVRREQACMKKRVLDALRAEGRWVTSVVLAELHNLPIRETSFHLSRLADYGQITRISTPRAYPHLYKIKRSPLTMDDALNEVERRRRERTLLDQHMLGQISTSELADTLCNEKTNA